jgi:hypothetical protein
MNIKEGTMHEIAILMIVAAILVIPATSEIDGNIKEVDWAEASVSGACPPIDFKPAIKITNTGDEKAHFYLTVSVFDNERGKERQTGCWSTQEIEPGDTALVWPYPLKLMSKYNSVKVTLFARSCLEDNILDTDNHTVELKSCS